MKPPVKEFVISRVIDDSFIEGEDIKVEEQHFGIPWALTIGKDDEFLHVHLECVKPKDEDYSWNVETVTALRAISTNGTSITMKKNCHFGHVRPSNVWGWYGFLQLENLKERFMVDGIVTIEAHSVITKMDGFGKEDLTKFNDTMKKFSDVVLVVKGREFHVLKKFLSRQSSYFEAMFMGNVNESNSTTVNLQDVDPCDFQNYLELLHGESGIDDNTVDGILQLGDMYGSPVCMKRCEEFLVEKSAKKLDKKFEISIRYKLGILKEKCIEDIKTTSELQSIFQMNIDEIALDTAKALLNKSITLSLK